jgi:hypothetical protein
MKFKYTVTLPYKPSSDNASAISDDGKTLTWDLLAQGNNTIKFTFDIYNLTVVYIGVGVIALLLIGLIILIIKLKKKAGKETLIHADYDQSIVGEISETKTPIETGIPTSTENLEYTVPQQVVTDAAPEVVTDTPLAGDVQETVVAPPMPEQPVQNQINTGEMQVTTPQTVEQNQNTIL